MNTTPRDALPCGLPEPAGCPEVTAFFEEATFTVTYLVRDPASRSAAIVDPVLDFDPASGHTSTTSAAALLSHVRERQLDVELILETHVHADHLTAAPYLREHTGAPVGIGANIRTVQKTFAGVFNAEPGFRRDGAHHGLGDAGWRALAEGGGDRFRAGDEPGGAGRLPDDRPASAGGTSWPEA